MNLLILFYAIVAIESGNDWRAVGDNGKSIGPAQIQEGVVKDCNRILGKEIFTLADRTNFDKSYHMFAIYTNHYGKKYGLSDEVRARVWNGGPKGPEKKATEKYWSKVQSKLNQ